MLIFCIVRKTGSILLLLVGLMADRQTGRQADEIRVGFKIFEILYKLNYSSFHFVLYYCNVTTVLELHFSWFLSRKVYFKVCFEVQKIWLPFFSYQSLLLGTSVPNDKFIHTYIYIYIYIYIYNYIYMLNKNT